MQKLVAPPVTSDPLPSGRITQATGAQTNKNFELQQRVRRPLQVFAQFAGCNVCKQTCKEIKGPSWSLGHCTTSRRIYIWKCFYHKIPQRMLTEDILYSKFKFNGKLCLSCWCMFVILKDAKWQEPKLGQCPVKWFHNLKENINAYLDELMQR